MNLLQIVQEFAIRTGLSNPSYVVGSLDPQVTQFQGLANEICEDLIGRFKWQELTREAVFTSVGTENQGLLTTLAPYGFQEILPFTFFDRTQHLPISGPVSDVEWQSIKALSNTGPVYRFRIREGSLYFTPIPLAGHTCAFEYRSSYPIYNATDVTYKPLFTKDADEFLLDYKLLLAGLRWKWKSEKGLPYAEDFDRYEELCNNLAGRNGSKPVLRMDNESQGLLPGIFVPAGSWRLP